jgi:adenylosuccinate synthase
VLQSSASKKAQTKSVKSEVDDSAALIAKLDAAYDKLEESDRLKREARGELALAEAGIRGDIAVKSARAASRVEMLKLKHDQQVDEIQSELVELKKLAGLVDPAPPVE